MLGIMSSTITYGSGDYVNASTMSQVDRIPQMVSKAKTCGGKIVFLGSELHFPALIALYKFECDVITVDIDPESNAAYEQHLARDPSVKSRWRHIQGCAVEWMRAHSSEEGVWIVDPLWNSDLPFSFSNLDLRELLVSHSARPVWLRAPYSWRLMLKSLPGDSREFSRCYSEIGNSQRTDKASASFLVSRGWHLCGASQSAPT